MIQGRGGAGAVWRFSFYTGHFPTSGLKLGLTEVDNVVETRGPYFRFALT